MNILVVNDDSINAEGIRILTKAAAHFGTVYVAAPKYQQSAKSAAISIKGPIEIEEIEPILGSVRTLVVDGTPVDSLRAGVKLFDIEFDLVLSGINHGVNLATDVHYSGTVAAAFESLFYNIPAIAFSAPDVTKSYIYDEVIKILDEIIENKVYLDTDVLNVNFPDSEFKKVLGVRLTKLGKRTIQLEYMKTDKPNLYNLSGYIVQSMEHDDSDIKAHQEGYISITPLSFDRTDYKKLKTTFE